MYDSVCMNAVNLSLADEQLFKRNREILQFYSVVCLCLAVLIMLTLVDPGMVVASDGYSSHKLTDIFTTDAFSGNWEVFTKMNWLGKIMSWVISAFSLIGIFSVGIQVMLNLLYLSGKNFWDNIDEIKSAGKNQKMFGMKAAFSDLYNAKYGTGLDAFISFFFSLFPNIKAYSQYATDAKHKGNYAETDTVVSYLLKSSLSNILIIFAFTMGFNGTLWQAYGTVVEALGVVTQNFADTNLSKLVDRAMNTGSSYTFAYSADGTKYGDFKQSVVKKVYASLLRNTTDNSTDMKTAIGKAIDSELSTPIDCMAAIAANYTIESDGTKSLSYGEKDSVKFTTVSYASSGENFNVTFKNGNSSKKGPDKKSLVALSQNIADTRAKNLSYSVVVNKTKDYSGAYTISADSLGFTDSGFYVHIFISKKANSDEHSYFAPSKDKSGMTDSGNSSSSDKDNSPTVQKK